VQNILAWFDNTFQGAVKVCDALSSGRLELTLLHQPTGLPPALATNAGGISIAGDSVFHIAPFLFTTAPGPFFDGVANFDNEGLILVAPRVCWLVWSWAARQCRFLLANDVALHRDRYPADHRQEAAGGMAMRLWECGNLADRGISRNVSLRELHCNNQSPKGASQPPMPR